MVTVLLGPPPLGVALGESPAPSVRPDESPSTGRPAGRPVPLVERPLTLEEMERRYIEAALERNAWHQGHAAAELGISVKTLYRKIRGYGFHRPGARDR